MVEAIDKGLRVAVRDLEDSNTVLGFLDANSWWKAEELMLLQYRKDFGDILSGNDDAITADVFFQLAVMGEVVYG